MEIRNSVVLVTGSADRVGKAIARTLAGKGARIVIHYKTNQEKARTTAAEIARDFPDASPLLVQGDVASRESWVQMKKTILNKWGRIDVLVNNAAIFYKTPFFQITDGDWDNFLNTNLKSVFLGCQIIGEEMVKRGKGKIINIADVSAYTIWADYIPYCLSKAAVISLTRGLAKALAPHVLVNAVAPGTVLLAKQHDPEEEQKLINRTPLKRIGSPEDIASAVAFLIEGSDFITGEVINVDGGRSLV